MVNKKDNKGKRKRTKMIECRFIEEYVHVTKKYVEESLSTAIGEGVLKVRLNEQGIKRKKSVSKIVHNVLRRNYKTAEELFIEGYFLNWQSRDFEKPGEAQNKINFNQNFEAKKESESERENDETDILLDRTE